MNPITVTPKQVFGYALLAIALSLFLYVGVSGLLLVTGVTQPLHVEMNNAGYGNDVFAGIILQVGIYSIFIGSVFVLSNIGLKLTKED